MPRRPRLCAQIRRRLFISDVKEAKVEKKQGAESVSGGKVNVAPSPSSPASCGLDPLRDPLVPALTALAEQVEDERLARVLADVKGRVNEGASLGDAMAAHPKTFSNIYVNMVRAGESSGALDVVLERLADFTEGQAELKSKVIGALIYPVVMVIAGALVMFGLFIFVVPRITKIFSSAEAQLPLLTHAHRDLEVMRNPVLMFGLFALAVRAPSCSNWVKTKGRSFDAFKLRVPLAVGSTGWSRSLALRARSGPC